VLRVIVKWIEELERKVRNLATGKTTDDLFTVKSEEPVSRTLDRETKTRLQSVM